MEEHDIKYITFENNQSPDGGLNESIIKESLQILLNSQNYPVLINCKLGKYLTGVVVGCLRKYQRWAFASIFEEYRRFAGSKMHQQHEQFIELFDTDLVSPKEESIPVFLERFM
jgi:tyrosine-protein phosphatase OCA1